MIFQKLIIILIFSHAKFVFANDLNDKSNRTNSSKIFKSNEESEINPEESGDYPEGDIVNPVKKIKGKARESLLWPNGQVYFDIGPEFGIFIYFHNHITIKFLSLF